MRNHVNLKYAIIVETGEKKTAIYVYPTSDSNPDLK